MPPTDLIGILDGIGKKAADNDYKSQYEFDSAIQKMLGSAYDGHLDASLCSTSIMSFSNNVPLISISKNGTAIPEVYTFSKRILTPIQKTTTSKKRAARTN